MYAAAGPGGRLEQRGGRHSVLLHRAGILPEDRGRDIRRHRRAAVASNCCGTYYASKGQGAYMDGKKITPLGREGKPIYAIYSYGAGPMPEGLIALEEDEDCIVRTMGSIALDICMVARGSFDAVMDTRSKVSGYDFMGAALILLEAGGHICHTDGRDINELPLDTTGVSIIAASDRGLMDRLLTVISMKKRE